MRLGESELDYEPGREHHTGDGQRLLATADQLFFLDEGGKIVRTERNGRAARWRGFTPSEQREIEVISPKPKGGDRDDAILELWIKQRNITPYEQAKARAVYATFKGLVHGKAFANCSRDDGRTLVPASARTRAETGNDPEACRISLRGGEPRHGREERQHKVQSVLEGDARRR